MSFAFALDVFIQPGEATLGAAAPAVLWRSLVIAAPLGALGVGVSTVLRNQNRHRRRFGPFSDAPNRILGDNELPRDGLLAPGIALTVSIA